MYTIPFGKDHLCFDLPTGMKGTVAASRHTRPIKDLEGAISQALAEPINSPPLSGLAKPRDRVCIVFTDITRAGPDHLLVPAMLKELETAGIPDDQITLLCGVGLHRPSTYEEKVIKLGEEVVDRYRVVDHNAQDPNALIDLGKTESGIPLTVNRLAYEADLLMATGIVEPHQFAGYSGGRKTVAIGAAGEAMIAYTHGPKIMDHPGTRLGKIEGNPFHEGVSEAARRAGLKFILNVVQDEQKRPVAVLAGEPDATFQELVGEARRLYEVPIYRQYDVAVAGVGRPKDVNIYQACRAASYLFFAPVSVVKENGVIIVPAPTPEGAGEGVGEQRFFEKMRDATDMPSLLTELRESGYPPGAQRAFIMAKVLEKADVIIVGSKTPDIVRQVHMIPAADMEQAFHISAQKIGKEELNVLIVPHALLTLPIVS
ncbi:MAG: nickel-dependent lactate racemase [Desulfobacteraceae bacterium]|nr:nickel-dependent lactate racemase [Desulfobacteraceae bacterium]